MTQYGVAVDDASVDPHDANLLGALVVGLHDAMTAAMVEAADLDATGVAALLLIEAHPGLSITELASALQVTHSGAVRSLARLSARDLVLRGEGRDRRSHGLRLTSAGLALAERVLAARREVLGGAMSRLPSRELPGLTRVLEVLLAGLPRSRTDAWRICRVCEHAACQGPACPVGSVMTAIGL